MTLIAKLVANIDEAKPATPHCPLSADDVPKALYAYEPIVAAYDDHECTLAARIPDCIGQEAQSFVVYLADVARIIASRRRIVPARLRTVNG